MADDAVAAVKARLDIVDVLSGYVRLTRSGREYKALCPFHSESTPSLTVSQERQVWYCFGCQEGGDMFRFVERIEQIGFGQALELLAERAGVEIERTPGTRKGEKTRLRELCGRASAYFEHVLWSTPAGQRGRELLEEREVPTELAHSFGLGFAPAGGAGHDALSRYLLEKARAVPSDVIASGLAYGRGSHLADRFVDRLIFPVRNERGDVIAFAGRALGAAVPKYLNSPETPLYHKSFVLFGLDMARKAIAESRSAVIVEGYFDVLACHAAGIVNAVACSGTAVTSEHLASLRRIADSVTLLLDSDSAGRAAASRVVLQLASQEVPMRIAQLPDGFKDPDELRRADPARLAAVVAGARPEWEVLLEWEIGQVGADVQARREAGQKAAKLLARIPSGTTRELYVQQAAALLHVGEASLLADIGRQQGKLRAEHTSVVRVAPPTPVAEKAARAGLEIEKYVNPLTPWERNIGAAVAQRPALARVVVEDCQLPPSEVTHPALRHLVESALEQSSQGGSGQLDLQQLQEEIRPLAAELMLVRMPILELDEAGIRGALEGAVRLMREAQVQSTLQTLQLQLSEARQMGRSEEVDALLLEINRLGLQAPRLRRIRKG